MKKKNRVQSYSRKTIIIALSLFVLLTMGVGYSVLGSNISMNGNINVKKYELKLYDVFQKEYDLNTGYVRQYTGLHQDTMSGVGDQNIYYWYSKNDSQSETIKEKNNVIFANHCWQMFRTTDTGGVKLIYNGEVENNQCLTTRGNHMGFNDVGPVYLYPADKLFWFGTDYEYDKENGVFQISGDLEQTNWNEENSSHLIGKFTCGSDDPEAQCSTMNFIYGFESIYYARAMKLDFSSHYSQFGKEKFNAQYDNTSSPAYLGYMFSNHYKINRKYDSYVGTILHLGDPLDQSEYELTQPDDASYGYVYDEDTRTWSSSTYNYTGEVTIKPKVTGTYVFNYELSDDWYSGAELTITKNDEFVRRERVPGLVGSVVFENLTPDDEIGFYIYKFASYYPGYVTFSLGIPSGETVDNRFLYGSDVVYENGMYTLVDAALGEPIDTNLNKHYTCWDAVGTCSTVSFVVEYPRNFIVPDNISYYIQLEDGKKVDDAIYEMFHVDNVNQTSSTFKIATEEWYRKFMLPYDQYIEDTIYCNNRNIKRYGNWDPSSYYDGAGLIFYATADDYLYCYYETDRFSVSNPKAPLQYKVGVITDPEVSLANNTKVWYTGQVYWTMSPGNLDGGVYTYDRNMRYVSSYSGTTSPDNAGRLAMGVRPVISLNPGTKYSSGDGSMENPYVVATN